MELFTLDAMLLANWTCLKRSLTCFLPLIYPFWEHQR